VRTEAANDYDCLHNFHGRTVHLDIIEVFYLPTDAQNNCLKRILKFTLKQLLHVSVQSSSSSGSALVELAKVMADLIIYSATLPN
jgi:hypothetical protein